MRSSLLVVLLPLLATSCANPFADSCGGPSILPGEGFSLRVLPGVQEVRVPPDGASTVMVCAIRYRFFDDPIDVTVTGLPPGITTDGATIRPGHYSAHLVLRADTTVQNPLPRKIDVSGSSGTFDSGLELWLTVRGTPGSLDITFGDRGEVVGDLGEPGGVSRVLGVEDAGRGTFVVGNSHGLEGPEADGVWLDPRGALDPDTTSWLRLPRAWFESVYEEASTMGPDPRFLLVAGSTKSPGWTLLEYEVFSRKLLVELPAPPDLEQIAASSGGPWFSIVGPADHPGLLRLAPGEDFEPVDLGQLRPVAIRGLDLDMLLLASDGSSRSLWRLNHATFQSALLTSEVPEGLRAIAPAVDGSLYLSGGFAGGGGYVLRLDADGKSDGRFGFGGFVPFRGLPEVVRPLDDGSLIVLSSEGDRCSVVQLDPIGRPLRTFDADLACGSTHVAAIGADRRLIVAGERGRQYFLRRYWL